MNEEVGYILVSAERNIEIWSLDFVYAYTITYCWIHGKYLIHIILTIQLY